MNKDEAFRQMWDTAQAKLAGKITNGEMIVRLGEIVKSYEISTTLPYGNDYFLVVYMAEFILSRALEVEFKP